MCYTVRAAKAATGVNISAPLNGHEHISLNDVRVLCTDGQEEVFTMNVEAIRRAIERLFRTDPRIHISLTVPRPKTVIQNDPAVITGIYPHMFRIEEHSEGVARCHTIRYADVAIGQVTIAELS